MTETYRLTPSILLFFLLIYFYFVIEYCYRIIIYNPLHYCNRVLLFGASLVAQMVKNLPAVQETRVQALGQVPWRREWQPTPVFPPGELPRQRKMGYNPWSCKVTKFCLTLWDPVDCSPPGSPVHGTSQARLLEWVVISFSRDRTRVSCLAGRFFTTEPTNYTSSQKKKCRIRWHWNCWFLICLYLIIYSEHVFLFNQEEMLF